MPGKIPQSFNESRGRQTAASEQHQHHQNLITHRNQGVDSGENHTCQWNHDATIKPMANMTRTDASALKTRTRTQPITTNSPGIRIEAWSKIFPGRSNEEGAL